MPTNKSPSLPPKVSNLCVQKYHIGLLALIMTVMKNSCDHLSLYRARRMYYKTFQTASTQIREGVPANNNEWGSIPGVTIRLKVQGSDYNHCKVLVGK